MYQAQNRFLVAATALGVVAGSITSLAQDAGAPPPPDDATKWKTTAAAGLTLTSGNSDSVMFTANVLGVKKWAQNELRLGADGAYGENNDVKSAETAHAFGQFNRLFSERTFGYVRIDALHDGIADVDYRLTFSPGAGYYFIKNKTTSLVGELGPAFIYEKLGNETTGYFTLRLAERFEHQLNERVRIWQSIEILPQVDDFENFLVNAEIGVETELIEKLKLRVFAVDNYDNRPAPGRKKNDLKLVTAIAYEF